MDLETSELGWKHYNGPDIIDLTVTLNFGGKILECFQVETCFQVNYYRIYLVFRWIVDPGDVSPSSSPFSSALLTLANVLLELIICSVKKKSDSYLSPYHIIQRCLCFEDLNCFFDFASTSEGSTTIAGHAGHPEYRPQTRSPISNSKLK